MNGFNQIQPRPYQNINDLSAMLDLLSAGRMAGLPAYHVHRGDLQWWLFYAYTPQEVWQANIRLWEQDDKLIGWALLSFKESVFDVYASPELCGTNMEQDMIESVIQEMSLVNELQTMWVSEDDHWRIRLLERHGFTLEEEHLILLQRVLADPLPVHELPAGYTLRHSRGISDALLRSEASAAAFKSSKPWDEYLARTMRFIQSPVYVPENEILLTAPDGRVASFCIVWTDPLSKIGLFEPVGTHPDFQGKGLGKYLMFGGLNRLKSQGMNEATVCVDSDNPAGIRLYESVGFRKVKSLLSYKKSRE